MLKHLLIGAIALSGLALTAADNLVKNPGFEEKGAWSIWGTHPEMTQEDRQSVMTYDNTTAASGQWSLKITDKWDKFSPYVIQFVNIPSSTKGYLLTFKVKGTEDGAPFRAGVMFNKGDKHEYLGAKVNEFRAIDDWKEYTLAITDIKEGTDHFAITFGPCAGARENTGTIWVDDVSLVAAE